MAEFLLVCGLSIAAAFVIAGGVGEFILRHRRSRRRDEYVPPRPMWTTPPEE